MCEFAPAFVDTPKGDLDSSDSVDGPSELLVENSITYPYGTYEQFPAMTNSDLELLHNSAHDYAECSNAGLCNRTTGVCECFDGFAGAACQRMTCPGEPECSGHGTCQTLRRIGEMDFLSTYNLWSKNMVQGCVCDKGFFGHDCSERKCKYGVDPLYLDDISTVQIPSFFITVLTTSDYYDFTSGFAQSGTGYYRIKVYDHHGQGYLTKRIDAGASCDEVVAALESVPGRIIPLGQTVCYEKTFADQDPLIRDETAFRITYDALYQYYFDGTKTYGVSSRPVIDAFGYENSNGVSKSSDVLLSGKLYFLQFFGNIGYFQQPELNTHTFDGMRSSLESENGRIVARTWTNGMQGNNYDYFADRCEGVQVQLVVDNGEGFLAGKFLSDELLASCLGFGSQTDRGTMYKPHFIKLVRTQADTRDGGIMAAVFFDTTSDFVAGAMERIAGFAGGAWRILNPVYSLDSDNALYDVFASHGTLTATDHRAGAAFAFGSNLIHTYNTSFDLEGSKFNGDISCDGYDVGAGAATGNVNFACLDKNDLFLVLNPYNGADNPPFANLYTARSIRRLPSNKRIGGPVGLNAEDPSSIPESVENKTLSSQYLITADYNLNWASTAVGPSVFHIYKFVPNISHTYQYTSQCSNRGICNTFEGICECFFGYAGESCSEQNTVVA